MKILVVEDEAALAQDICNYLTPQNYLCEVAPTFSVAQECISMHSYDCILLDLMLPGGDGISLLRWLKENNKQDGIIVISAKNSLEDRVKGLELGADDYLAKPFHLSELAARIHSIIRRKQFDNSDTIQQGELLIDLQARSVHVHENPVVLTRKEFDLLVFFIGNKGRVLSKSALAEHLSGDLADMFDNYNFVYAHVKNLKRKLTDGGCKGYLKTIYGTGYTWEND